MLCRLFGAYGLQLKNIEFPFDGCLPDYVSAVRSQLNKLASLSSFFALYICAVRVTSVNQGGLVIPAVCVKLLLLDFLKFGEWFCFDTRKGLSNFCKWSPKLGFCIPLNFLLVSIAETVEDIQAILVVFYGIVRLCPNVKVVMPFK